MIPEAKSYIEEHIEDVESDPVMFLKNTPAYFFVDIHNTLIESGVIDHYEDNFYVHYYDGECTRYPARAKTLQGIIDAAVKILAEQDVLIDIGIDAVGEIMCNNSLKDPRTNIVKFSDGSAYRIIYKEGSQSNGHMWKVYDRHKRIK